MTDPAPDAENDARQRDHSAAIGRWADAILVATRQLGVKASPELVRNASAWSGDGGWEQAVLDIAHAAGLAGTFIDTSASDLTPLMLPAIVQIGDKHVGIITNISKEAATVTCALDGKAVERSLPLDQFRRLDARRFMVVQAREVARDSRIDRYLSEKPNSWLRGVFASNWRTLIDLGLGSLSGNLLAIGTSLFAMQVWDRVVPARSINTLWVLASGVAIALLLELLIRSIRLTITDNFGKQADLKLSAMFFARVLDIRNDARPLSPGSLISQLRELDQIRELLTSTTFGVLIDLPFVVAFLLIIWMIGGPLVFVPLAAIPLIVIPGVLLQFPLSRLANDGLRESALRNAILMESIYRAEDIKLLQAEPRFRKLWNDTNRTTGEISLKQRFIGGLLVNYSATIQQLAYAGVIIVGVYGILDGGLSLGAVLACSILTSRAIAPLGQIAGVLGRVQNARIGKKGLDNLIELPVDHDPEKDSYHKPALVGSYQFENVVYAYGSQEKPALTIPFLKIEPGERIAVLGRVGAGKSTLLRLAAGIATPTNGQILFNDTAMGLIDVADIRRDVALLLQDASLFYGTLRENLLIGNPHASDEQILEAMRLSSADQLLLNQPHGLDLQLRESGMGLSGGQKQALMLARLFLRAPNIVLLDEPTASLDEGTELATIERLKGWLGKRTLIVATHRYPVLSLVDRIIVVDGGRIALNGPKDEVLKVLSGCGTSPQNRPMRRTQY